MKNQESSAPARAGHHPTGEHETRNSCRRKGREAVAASQISPAACSIEPHEMDILKGRGKRFYQHPGNRRMLEIIGRYKPLYQEASTSSDPKDPRRVAALTSALNEILKPIDGFQPRFLKWDEPNWVLLNDREIREKVRHVLRSKPRISSGAGRTTTESNETEPPENIDMRIYQTSQGETPSSPNIADDWEESNNIEHTLDHRVDGESLMSLDSENTTNENELHMFLTEYHINAANAASGENDRV